MSIQQRRLYGQGMILALDTKYILILSKYFSGNLFRFDGKLT